VAKVHHTANVTREVDASLVFWRDGLGLDVLSYFKNENGKIATQLPQTSRWYAERTRRLGMKEYVRA
jgi:hypothetical protein